MQPPPPTAPSITTQPSSKTVVVGQPAAFTVAASGTAPLSYQWRKGGTDIPGATSASYTIASAVLGDSGSAFDVIVSNSVGSATSNTATLSVNPVPVDVLTYHYDNARTGANLNEAILTPGNVSSTTFGKVGFFATADGKVDAQPLYLSQLNIAGGTHNVLYVVSEGDTAYAFDADSGAVLWQKSMLVGSETTSDQVNGCSQVSPQIGITSTPVIDRARGTIYLVAMSKSGSSYFQRLHALDLATGAEKAGSPALIQATYPGTGDNSSGGNVVFDPKQYEERAALLLLNGVVYTTWTSHCDIGLYTGWVIGYDASTLAQKQVLNITPNGSEGAVWMAGAGPAADSSNNIYFMNGNGTFDTALDANGFPSLGDYGNSFIKLSTSGTLAVSDYFTMHNTVAESNGDIDLGSGGVIVLPDLTDSSSQVRHLAIGAGKDKILYLVDRDNMGKFHATDQIYQELSNVLANGVFSKPAYFNSTVFYGAFGDSIKAFALVAAKLKAIPNSKTANAFIYPGAFPSVSANGTSDAILWAVDNDATAAVLYAYDATNLATKLYDSNQASNSRDHFGPGNKFITPVVVNGRVFVGTQTGVAVFGQLP